MKVSWYRLDPRFFFPVAQQPPVSQVLLFIHASRSRSFRHTAFGRTPLDEWSACRRDIYLATHNTHKRHISVPAAGFELAIPTSERLKTHALIAQPMGSATLDYFTDWCLYTLPEIHKVSYENVNLMRLSSVQALPLCDDGANTSRSPTIISRLAEQLGACLQHDFPWCQLMRLLYSFAL
jgi:hypothetical protein